jgi:hypothetical protein
VALALLPQLLLLQHLEALAPKQVKLVDSLDQNQQPLEHLQQPLPPLHLVLERLQQPRQEACLASQPNLLGQLHRHLALPSQLPLPSELRRQALPLEVLVLLLPSQQPPLASLEIRLLNPHLDLEEHLLLQPHLGLEALGPRLPQEVDYLGRQLNRPNLPSLALELLLLLHQPLVLEASELLPTPEEVSLAKPKPNLDSALAAPPQLLPLGLAAVLEQPQPQLVVVCLVVVLSLEGSSEELRPDLELELGLELPQALEQVPPQVSVELQARPQQLQLQLRAQQSNSICSPLLPLLMGKTPYSSSATPTGDRRC